MICARRGSPLAIGYGDGEMFVGSDALALAPLTRRITYLEEGDWAVVTSARGDDLRSRTAPRSNAESANPPPSGALIGKGNYRHFMQKEIFEQPAVIGDTLQRARSTRRPAPCTCPSCRSRSARSSRITIIACGTAYHAGLVAKYWLERIARIPVEVDIASEFRYRAPAMPRGGAAIFISQSGETADTLAALRYAASAGAEASSRSSTSRKARSRAKPISSCRPWPGRRSASPRPRRSPPSSRCWRLSPWRWRGRAARSTPAARGRARRPARPRSRRAPPRC